MLKISLQEKRMKIYLLSLYMILKYMDHSRLAKKYSAYLDFQNV